jgi:hypothetical protein
VRWIKLWTKIIWDADIRELTAPARWVFVTLLALAADDEGTIKGSAATDKYLANAAQIDIRTLNKSVAILQQKCLINVIENVDFEETLCKTDPKMQQKCGKNAPEGRVILIPNWHKYQSTTTERNTKKNEKKSPLDKTREEDIKKNKNIHRVIFEAWTSHPRIRPKHVKLTTAMEKAINARITEGYTPEQICRAIKNYGDSTKEFWAKRREEGLWTLDLFLSRGEGTKGLGRFLDGPINDGKKDDKYIGGER